LHTNAIPLVAEILSGGEKQRLAIGRVLYHRPVFAALDECTSAVSSDIEKLVYQRLVERGITLLSVSHRSTLWNFHQYMLRFDGRGGYSFSKIDEEEHNE
jgi:ATP-binding cassette subfamily D (ALD) long-chain fatty acid import protein